VIMSSAYSFDGAVIVALLVICTCAYLKRVPRVSSWLLSEKKGFFGVLYKAAVVGVRLHSTVSVCCIAAAFYVLFFEVASGWRKILKVEGKKRRIKEVSWKKKERRAKTTTEFLAESHQVTLPKGVKQKVKKAQQKGPKRGHHTYIPPKKKDVVEQAKVSAEVTKMINQRNEEMLKERADRDVGRVSKKTDTSS
ncbi:Protein kish-B, partial [Toxocara canis]